MASIKYLNNITLIGNDLEFARIHPTSGAPTAYGDGQMYYDTGTNKLRVYENGAWVNIVTGNDVDTTYDLTAAGSTNGTAVVRLTGSDSTTDDVTITGANGTEVTRTANTNTIVVTGATVNNSTITLTAGSGLATGGSFTLNQASSGTITFDVDYAGTDNVILSATDAEGSAIATTDVILYSDSNDSDNVKHGLVSDLPFTNTQGTLTGIGAGDYILVDNTTPAVPQVSADATTTATADKLAARDSSGFLFSATPSSGDSSTKVATTAFVQASLTGLLEFKGGFNANTGALDSPLTGDLYTNVAIAVGDYYVVTTAGNFFGNTATPLTPGDSVIVQTAKSAGNAVEADFIVVQSDTDVASSSQIGIGNVAGTASQIGVSYSNGTATLTNLDRGSSQDIFKTISVSGQSDIVADTNSDTLTFAAGGATTITTNATSDTVTISSVNTEYSAMTTSTLGLGKIRYANNSTPAANAQTTTASRTYGVTKNSSDQLVVNVPWTDNSGPVDTVDESQVDNRLGIIVDPTTGDVKVGLNINGLTNVTSLEDDDTVPFYDDSEDKNNKFPLSSLSDFVGDKRTFANTGPASAGTTYTIQSSTHGLGTDSTLISVQLIEVSSGNTIYADVNRGASGLITINFASNQGVDSIKALLSLHG